VVTVVAGDLGAVRLTAVDHDTQIARATEYRAARQALDAAIKGCRIAWAFEERRAGLYVRDSSAYMACSYVHQQRSRAIALKSHAGRLRALSALTDYIRKL
jgi:hypothetical protein